MKTQAAVQNLVSGDWKVRPGAEEEFVARWTDFLEWTRASAPGFLGARLIRNTTDPCHFVSFAEWESPSARQAWRELPEFSAKLNACKGLCEDMRGVNYDLAVAI